MQFRVRPAPALNVRLPMIETAGKNQLAGAVTVGISSAGEFSFNGKPATEGQLTALLAQVSAVNKDLPVLIRADENSPVKKLAYAMDACRKAGLNKFSLQSR